MTCLAAWTAPGQVRTHIRFRLIEWGHPEIADDMYLIAGELVANAVEATPDGEIRVRFTREPDAVLLGVWDSADSMPTVRPTVELSLLDVQPDPLALTPGHEDGAGGWGLPLIEALSSECGVHRTSPHGKWVWSRVHT
ncbi:ATP-binding protein [Actinomadura sp. SCN-SB]|uniref:ATP-binding protein n=1 Tax=Actinomadura sp. SCN-SB TaxID=3373092 RepID=UPI00375317BB